MARRDMKVSPLSSGCHLYLNGHRKSRCIFGILIPNFYMHLTNPIDTSWSMIMFFVRLKCLDMEEEKKYI